MALSRMDDFKVAIDPRTGELRSASGTLAGRRLRPIAGRVNWRPFAIGSAVLFALVVAVFLAALVSELM